MLLFGRHQKSIGNKREYVQGTRFDKFFGLTTEGRVKANEIGKKLNDKKIEKIISSSALRSIQTARIYKTYLKVPLEIDDSLVEFNPGIIGDRLKGEIIIKYPEYYNIWSNREDLDNIPGAEKGKCLQARALFFLTRYLNRTSNDLIISHVGFLRCLINTMENRCRTTPIFIDYDYIYEFKNDPWDNIQYEKLENSKSSTVYKVTTLDQIYIIKILAEGCLDELRMQFMISQIVNENRPYTIPEILYYGKKNNFIQILSFIKGVHIFGPLKIRTIKKMIRTVYELECVLSKIRNNNFVRLTIFKKIDLLVKGNIVLEKRWTMLKSEIKKIEFDSQLIHYDLHRMNMLFDGQSIRLVDYDGFIYAPKFMQAASLFTACIFEDPKINLDWLISNWPEKLNYHAIVLGIQMRVLLGVAFFEKKRHSSLFSNDERDILEKYIYLLQTFDNIY